MQMPTAALVRNLQRPTAAKNALTKLRRKKFAANWHGGCWTLEITNESRGWHLHFHLLVEARWIDQIKLGQAWEEASQGWGYITKVKDARQQDYLAEVSKYVVKPTQMIAWEPSEIRDFMLALDNQRTFGVFGSLYGMRSAWSEFCKQLKIDATVCPCGCNARTWYNEQEWEWKQTTGAGPAEPRPPPVMSPWIDLTLESQTDLRALKR
jgi:hypothetical protein